MPNPCWSEQRIQNALYDDVIDLTNHAVRTTDVGGGGGSGSASGGGASTYYCKPSNATGMDAITAYAAATQLTVSGLPFAFVASDIESIRQIPNAGGAGAQDTVFADKADFTVGALTAGVQTITVANAAFAATDKFVVVLSGQIKTYTSATNSGRAEEVNPVSQQVIEESLLDTTNIAAATNYYPSSLGMAMLGYKGLSVSGKFIDADGTMTLDLEVTDDEDATNADWVSAGLSTVDQKTGVQTIAAALTVTNDTLTFAIKAIDFNWRFVRVKMVNDGATNTGVIKLRRIAS